MKSFFFFYKTKIKKKNIRITPLIFKGNKILENKQKSTV